MYSRFIYSASSLQEGLLPDDFKMKGLRKILRVSWTAKKTNEWALNKAGVIRELLDAVKARKVASVAAISSEWWGSWGDAPSGVQGQSPWSGDQRGIALLQLKRN